MDVILQMSAEKFVMPFDKSCLPFQYDLGFDKAKPTH